MAFKNPLVWPTGKIRTTRRHKAPFKAGITTTLNDLDRAARKLGLQDIRITVDQRVRVDGQLSQSSADASRDPGVTLYCYRGADELCIPFDKFTTIWGNLRAIGLYLEYMSRLENMEMGEMADQALKSYIAIPATTGTTMPIRQEWYDVLEVAPTASWEAIRAAYRALSAKYHPDMSTGDSQKFQAVQDAYAKAKQEHHQ